MFTFHSKTNNVSRDIIAACVIYVLLTFNNTYSNNGTIKVCLYSTYTWSTDVLINDSLSMLNRLLRQCSFHNN